MSTLFDIPDDLLTEATIQSEFFHQARLIGLNCVVEHVTPKGRLDIAVCCQQWKILLAIVEVKRGMLKHDTYQIKRYKSIGVPVYGLNNLTRCGKLAAQILEKHKSGVAIERVAALPRFFRGRRRKFDIADLDEDVIYKA